MARARPKQVAAAHLGVEGGDGLGWKARVVKTHRLQMVARMKTEYQLIRESFLDEQLHDRLAAPSMQALLKKVEDVLGSDLLVQYMRDQHTGLLTSEGADCQRS